MYEAPVGKSLNSEVCDMNTRHLASSPEPANRIPPHR